MTHWNIFLNQSDERLSDRLHSNFTTLTKLAAYKTRRLFKYVKEDKMNVVPLHHRSVWSLRNVTDFGGGVFLTLPHYLGSSRL